MELTPQSFATTPFGTARLGDHRGTQRLVQLAPRCAEHPGGSWPEKRRSPAALKALYRLAKHPAVTHAAVLAPHRAATRQRMAAPRGVVLLVHDTTALDDTGQKSVHAPLGRFSAPCLLVLRSDGGR